MTAPDGVPALLAGLRRRFDAALAEQLRGARAVAVLDFPDHDNVGDTAIWLGEQQALARLGVRIAYSATHGRHRDDVVDALPRDVPLLLHGGGNFGDVWPENHAFREHVVARFADRRIVQLPQTVWFADEAAAQRSAAALRRHPDLTVMTRDDEGTAYVRDVLGLASVLVPDAALAIDPATLPAPRPAEAPVVVQWRTDHESAGRRAAPAGVPVFDWFPPHSRRRQVLSAADARLRPAVASAAARRASTALHAAIATGGVHRGLAMVQRGEVLVTDRLHGVVLATLSGRRSVWVDNSYGKVGRLHDTWLSSSPLSRRADSPEEAVATARRLAGGA